MVTSVNVSAALAEDILRLRPALAPVRGALEGFLDACSSSNAEPFPDALAVARRRATVRDWAEGPVAWNARARDQLTLLERLQPTPASRLALLDVFAADFSDRIFTGLEASEAVFPGHLILKGATLHGACRLDGATVIGAFVASGATFEHELTADETRFAGPVALDRIEVARAARFSRAAFSSDVVLDGSLFGRELWMRGACLGGAFRMCRALLQRDASLGCSYAGPARFDGTHFADAVSFERAVFRDALSLEGCVFGGRVFLDDIDIGGPVSSIGATFSREVRPSADLLRKGSTVRDLIARVQAGL